MNFLKESPVKYASNEEFLLKLNAPPAREKLDQFIHVYSTPHDLSPEKMTTDLIHILNSNYTTSSAWAKRKNKNKNRKKGKTNKVPWYSDKCQKLKRSLNRAEKEYRKDHHNLRKRDHLFSTRKKFKSLCKASERAFRDKLSSTLFQAEKHNPENFWSAIKKMKQWGKNTSEPGESIPPSEWLDYFQNLLSEKSTTSTKLLNELQSLEQEPYFSELDYQITDTEVSKALKRLNTKASPGPDKIPGSHLLAGKIILMPVLKLFFNKMFSMASHSSIFSLNYMKAIFKKGDPSDPDNYRGIAIGSVLAKVFNLIILERVESRICRTHPISSNQIGFKKGHRTGDHIFVLNSIVNKIVKNEKRKLFTAFIDFRKAFDRINHELLFLKLQRLGIKGLLYKNIKAMYQSITYLVRVCGGHLDPIKSFIGLKQGGVLSPLFFNIYIDDIASIFDETCDPLQAFHFPLSHLLYADDLVIMSTSHQGLNKCLENLDKYCKTWQLEVNLKKSQVVIFNPAGRLLNGYSFKYQGKPIQIVKNYCYLGIDFACSGSLRLGRKNIMEKACKAMSPLLSIIPEFKITCKKSLNLFHSFIRPIALYNSENLAHLTHHQIRALEENKTTLLEYVTKSEINTVHQKFLKYVLGVKRSCSNIATLGELGEFPLHIHGLVSMLSFWHRTTQMHDDTLVKHTLNLITNDGPNSSEWVATVKFLLKFLGIENYFTNPTIVDTKKFTALCLTKFKQIFIDQWKMAISRERSSAGATNKLRFYSRFKTVFEFEPYLDYVNNFHVRKTIAKFRCSDHKLKIESGRHQNLEVNERICDICKTDVETEMHFLAICSIYEPLRNRYFENMQENDFLNLLKCRDKSIAFKIGNYITKASKIREDALST